MHRTLPFSLLLALLAGIALPANAQCLNPGDPPGEIPLAQCIDASDADADWLFLALHTPGGDSGVTPPCPGISGWTGTRLFFDSDPLVPTLARYCRYEADSSDSPVALLTNNLCSNGADSETCFDELEPERLVVTGQQSSGDTEAVVWPTLQSHVLEQVGAPGALGSGPANVRLSVVDTEPTGPGQELNGPGVADHGFGLLNLARDMLCNDAGGCAVQPASVLGLPLRRCSTQPSAACSCASPEPQRTGGFCIDDFDDAADDLGGHLGGQGDLARGIYAAQRSFEQSAVARHVINLSVGWDPRYGGTPPLASAPLGVRAVRDALTYAHCRGALIVAAAGNRTTGPDTTPGPLLPGAWESIAAPTQAQCNAFLNGLAADPSLFAGGGAAYRPLLYAVGAVDEANARLRVRDDGEPALTAYGSHATADWFDAGTQTPTGILTGTSVGSLVVAASAAAAWHHRPAEASFNIAAQVYASGENTGRTAQFCDDSQGAGCDQPVRRILACEAINQACAALPGATCPTYTCPPRSDREPDYDFTALETAYLGEPNVDISRHTNSTTVTECGSEYVIHWANGDPLPQNPCPHRQFYAMQVTPYVSGQPEGEVCEPCLNQFQSPGKFYLEVVSSFLTPVLDATLLCNGEGYYLANQLMPGDKLRAINIPLSCENAEISVAFRVPAGDGSSASTLSLSLKSTDADGDGVTDNFDNCALDANPSQFDADNDGIGNICDTDLNNDCIANVLDLGIFRTLFFTNSPIADFNEDGTVNVLDLAIFRARFFTQPGPSALPNACE